MDTNGSKCIRLRNLRANKNADSMRRIWLFALSWASILGLAFSHAATAQTRFPCPMLSDPQFVAVERDRDFVEGLVPLWLRALERPEPDLKIDAAHAFASAYRMGMRDLEHVHHHLLREFQANNVDTGVQLACAQALVELDASIASDAFAAVVADATLSLAHIIEPALAEWNNESMIPIWRDRAKSNSISDARRELAIDGLAKVQDPEAVEMLLSLVFSDKESVRIRFRACDAIVDIHRADTASSDRQRGRVMDTALPLWDRGNRSSSRNDAPRYLSQGTQFADRIIAARLAALDGSDESLELLRTIAEDPSDAVAVIALESLWVQSPESLEPLVAAISQRNDPRCRQLAVRIYIAQQSTTSVSQLTMMLADQHPRVRTDARLALQEQFVGGDHDQAVWDSVDLILRRDAGDWRSTEQALLMVAHMNKTDFADMLLPHLHQRRSEVRVTAAWAISVLSVPETFEESLAFCQQLYDDVAESPILFAEEEQLCHLFQMFGINDYEPSKALMRQFIDKRFELGVYSRGAAIWALGLMYEDTQDAELGELFAARLEDIYTMIAEVPIVRQMSANALGRMKCEAQLAALEMSRDADALNHPIQFTSSWAIERITGEPIEPVVLSKGRIGVWFLEPFSLSDEVDNDSNDDLNDDSNEDDANDDTNGGSNR